MPTAVPAMPGMAPIAAAMIGIRAGRKPPFRDRRRVAVRLRRLPPVPVMGTARARVPVARSLAVAGVPDEAAARAASETAGDV
uniref:Viral peptide n=1 Tax=Fowl adenovirus A serotype 1 (strain CELO / Phelps) TaxID=10553 RepID=Q96582_ADEG1|nr:viral peptide [Fowl aviadenovirus 1]